LTFSHLINLKAAGESNLIGLEIVKVHGSVAIGNWIALPILTSNSFDRDNDVVIKNGTGEIGKIKFLKNHETIDYTGLPDELMICFYIDYDQEHITEPAHKFKSDYLLIKKRNFNKYKRKQKKTSPLWGNFFHLDDIPSITFEETNTITELKVRESLKVENQVYYDNLYLSIIEPNPFNRFLKLYHLLELQFDMHTAEKIQSLLLQGNKEKEISSKLKEYTQVEIKRFFSLIQERCTDFNALLNKMNEVILFQADAEKIFYEYGKDSNPLRKKKDFKDILSEPSGLKFTNQSYIEGLGANYSTIIPKLCAYWIYRVRCSIAHNKFGEYMMDQDDEDFVVKFAEPLLLEVVIQCFDT